MNGTSGLTPPETEEIRKLTGHVPEVLTGYQRGSEALALPGEPQPQYAPGSPKLERCRAKAAELDVSVMTARRMIWRFGADGPEGLTAYGQLFARDVPPPWNHSRNPERQGRQSRNVTPSSARDCSPTRQPARRELFDYNKTPSSWCSSSRDPYTVLCREPST